MKRDNGNLIGFRPDIKVVDCTLRDGGLVNNFEFSGFPARGGQINFCIIIIQLSAKNRDYTVFFSANHLTKRL